MVKMGKREDSTLFCKLNEETLNLIIPDNLFFSFISVIIHLIFISIAAENLFSGSTIVEQSPAVYELRTYFGRTGSTKNPSRNLIVTIF